LHLLECINLCLLGYQSLRETLLRNVCVRASLYTAEPLSKNVI